MKFEKVRFECFENDSINNGFEHFIEDAYDMIKMPERKTTKSCGYDFSTPYKVKLQPNERRVIPTGIKAVDMPPSMALLLYIRSSVGIKKGVVFSNGTGVIDSDFANNAENDGDIHLALWNTSEKTVVFEAGERIAQGVFVQYSIVVNDSASGKRKGGIGSTND